MLHRNPDTQIPNTLKTLIDNQESHRRHCLQFVHMTTPQKVTTELVSEWQRELFNERSLAVSVAELSKWPLRNYLWAAVFQAKELYEARDPNDQNWQTPAWDFGRFAKAHPILLNMDEDEALRTVKKTIGSKFWVNQFQMDPNDAEMAFDDIWIKCERYRDTIL